MGQSVWSVYDLPAYTYGCWGKAGGDVTAAPGNWGGSCIHKVAGGTGATALCYAAEVVKVARSALTTGDFPCM